MVTPYEEDMLRRLIHDENQGQPLSHNGRSLDFDADRREIVARDNPAAAFPYTGSREKFSLLPRIAEKNARGRSFEAHLQAHIVGNCGNANDPLSRILLGNSKLEWLGNEVSCGVGMQRIDLMLSYTEESSGMRHVMPVELKTEHASADNIRQVQRYVDWIRQYYIPNHRSVISPVLLTKGLSTADEMSLALSGAFPTDGASPDNLAESIRRFNNQNAGDICKPLRLVKFSVTDTGIEYDEITVPSIT